MEKVRALNAIADGRGQSLAQMAIAWTLRDQRVTSALIGAGRSVAQLEDSLAAPRPARLQRGGAGRDRLVFAPDSGINLLAESSRE